MGQRPDYETVVGEPKKPLELAKVYALRERQTLEV